MEPVTKPYVHFSINAVDTVVHDPACDLDPDLHDRYQTFQEARDAALSCVEILLDEHGYDGEDHREELERMRELLETSQSCEELEHRSEYRWFLEQLVTSP